MHFFLPDDIFLTCDHELDLNISLSEIFNPLQFNTTYPSDSREKVVHTKISGKKTPQHL